MKAAIGISLALIAGVAAQTSGTFSVLTYNIAGLPELVSSGNPEANTPEIGRRISPYDVVHVQEDFNYHAALYANNNHPFRTATSGGAGFGSGLNSLSRFAFTDEERVEWRDCYGVFDHGSDCLTPKGYTFMRAQIAPGVFVDLYNLHTDADSDEPDLAARRSNILQVVEAVNTRSVGFPVVVMGDTNTRYTRSGDNIDILRTQAGLTDPWIQRIRGGSIPPFGDALVCELNKPTNSCETVDKIFYRGSRTVRFNAITYSNEHLKFLDASGWMLSDHYPHAAWIEWSLSSDLRLSNHWGGPHGSFFNDLPAIPDPARNTIVVSFTIRGGSRVDAVRVVLRASATAAAQTLSHGGTGGTDATLTLNAGEHVTSAYICTAKHNNTTRVFYLRLTTTTGRTVARGATTSDCVTYTAPAGFRVVGFYGRSGAELDRVGLVYAAI